jgi:periplasmic divalent cation tolerance protein
MNHVMVYMTAANPGEARKIGECLIREKLAACVNIIPEIESVYWWKERVEKAKESVLIAKTRQELSGKIIERVKELHSYDVPCIDVIPVVRGNDDYFRWIDQSLR